VHCVVIAMTNQSSKALYYRTALKMEKEKWDMSVKNEKKAPIRLVAFGALFSSLLLISQNRASTFSRSTKIKYAERNSLCLLIH